MNEKKNKDLKYAGLVLKLTNIIHQLKPYLTDDEIARLIALGLQDKEVVVNEIG